MQSQKPRPGLGIFMPSASSLVEGSQHELHPNLYPRTPIRSQPEITQSYTQLTTPPTSARSPTTLPSDNIPEDPQTPSSRLDTTTTTNPRPRPRPIEAVPTIPGYPPRHAPIPNHLTCYEVCQHYPNSLYLNVLDAFIQHNFSCIQVFESMPPIAQEVLSANHTTSKNPANAIAKRMTKRRDHLAKKLLLDNMMNGRVLREHGMGIGWKGRGKFPAGKSDYVAEKNVEGTRAKKQGVRGPNRMKRVSRSESTNEAGQARQLPLPPLQSGLQNEYAMPSPQTSNMQASFQDMDLEPDHPPYDIDSFLQDDIPLEYPPAPQNIGYNYGPFALPVRLYQNQYLQQHPPPQQYRNEYHHQYHHQHQQQQPFPPPSPTYDPYQLVDEDLSRFTRPFGDDAWR